MKQKMYRYISICGILLTVCVLLAACSASDGDDVKSTTPQQLQTPTEITVKTNVKGMLQRATTIDDNSDLQVQDLKIDAYFNGTDTKYLDEAKLHYDTDAWKFWDGEAQLHYYWPIEGSVHTASSTTVSSLDFVGFCPYVKPSYITTGPTYSYSEGTVSFAATMPTTTVEAIDYMTSDSQASFTEFMLGIVNDRRAAGGAVPLTFKHPFACVKFSLSSATTKNVTVTEISINDLKTGGSCVFNGSASTWSEQTGNATMKLTEELHRDETEATSPFLVIPNNYGATQKTLTVKITWREWDEELNMTFTTPLTINWAAGYLYTFSLTVTKDDLKVDVEKFTEQW